MTARRSSQIVAYTALTAASLAAAINGCGSDGSTCRVNCGGSSGTTASSSSTVTSASSTSSTSTAASSSTATSSSTSSTPASDGGGSSVICADPNPGLILYDGTPAPTCLGDINLPGQGWFSYDDGTNPNGVFTHDGEMAGCGGPMTCAFHAAGSGYTGYGAGVGFDLKSMNNAAEPSDAAVGYMHFSAWLKGTTTGTRGNGYAAANNTVHVKFVSSTFRAGDEFGVYCPTQGDAGAGWVQCDFPINAVRRDGFAPVDAGAPPIATDTFDWANLEQIEFEFSSYTPPADSGVGSNVSFDLYIDDVAFY